MFRRLDVWVHRAGRGGDGRLRQKTTRAGGRRAPRVAGPAGSRGSVAGRGAPATRTETIPPTHGRRPRELSKDRGAAGRARAARRRAAAAAVVRCGPRRRRRRLGLGGPETLGRRRAAQRAVARRRGPRADAGRPRVRRRDAGALVVLAVEGLVVVAVEGLVVVAVSTRERGLRVPDRVARPITARLVEGVFPRAVGREFVRLGSARRARDARVALRAVGGF